MKTLHALTMRNIRMYFKDKAMFLTSLITPLILLVLYSTFLKSIYDQTFTDAFAAAGIQVSDALLEGCSGGQMVSSLLSVSCVTVVFCCNLLMVQDRANGTYKDLQISPVSSGTIALSYFLAAFLSSWLISICAETVCMFYLYFSGWFMTFNDLVLITADVTLLVLFGTALSSLCCAPLTTQGQASALGTIISAGYGFICGAYMPISQFSKGIQNIVSLLPGTYGTSLLRNRIMHGVFIEMENRHMPSEMIRGIKDSIDVNLYFNSNVVPVSTMLMILLGTTVILSAAYLLLRHAISKKSS